jgi:hypothetical protein
MMEAPRIFVGTMYMNEGDFQLSMERVRSQEGVTVTHFIVAGLKEKEAHNALWHAWKDQQSNHDLFVKVDADTVLVDNKTLRNIYDLFAKNERVTGLQAPLHDYMTDGLINGLNAFSPRVVFNDTQDELYCDRLVDTGHDVVLREKDLPATLIPAGFHCHSSSDKQAFHYGVHRALKGQTTVISKVWAAWNKNHDRIRAFALIGSYMSHRFKQNRKFNYMDNEFISAFEEAEKRYDEFAADLALGRFDRIR